LPTALLQRTGLALDNGRVVFAFGGNFGDCSTYHGYVESVPEAGGQPSLYEVDAAAGQDQGAIWMGGAAPVVDSAGNIWVAIGNGSVTDATQPYDGSDAVVELSPSLTRLQYFAPSQWARDNQHDADLGSSAPAVLPNGLVVQVGKAGIAYLLRASSLGGVGGQLSQLQACSTNTDGGDAFSPTSAGAVVYLPCLSGLVALSVTTSPPSMKVLWQTPTGSSGPPIIADGLVWTISRQGIMYGLSPTTGQPVQQIAVGQLANHFPTPSVGDGLLLAPTESHVVAYWAPSAASAPATTTTTTKPRSTTTTVGKSAAPHTSSSGGSGALVVALLVIGLLVVAAVMVLLLLRGRRSRPGAGPPA
jgi:hypothetical protein